MSETQKSKLYDLEARTLEFARSIRAFIKKLEKTLANYEDAKQLIRSSGSVGANYIEANEALSKKRFYSKDQNLPQRGEGIHLLAQFTRGPDFN